MKLVRRETGEEIEVKAGLLIGRTTQDGLQIQDGSVSRRHAEVVREGSGFGVKDLGSSNGTFHNGRRLKEFSLRDGDLVTFGAVAFDVKADAVDPTDRIEAVLEDIKIEDEASSGVLREREAPGESSPVADRPTEPDSRDTGTGLADEERARIRAELKRTPRSRGFGDLGQLSPLMQFIVLVLAIGFLYGVFYGVRYLGSLLGSDSGG